MGYTHSWKREVKLDKKLFNNFLLDIKILNSKIKNNLSDCGIEEFDITPSQVFVGGTCESFYFPCKLSKEDLTWYRDVDGDGKRFMFCKTNRAPYDIYVQIILLLAFHHFGINNIILYSNGEYEEWQDALDYVIDNHGYFIGGNFLNKKDFNWDLDRVNKLERIFENEKGLE